MFWDMIRNHYPLTNPEIDSLEKNLGMVLVFCMFVQWCGRIEG